MEFDTFEKLRKVANEADKVPKLQEEAALNRVFKEFVLTCFKVLRKKDLMTWKRYYEFDKIGEMIYNAFENTIEDYARDNTHVASFETTVLLNSVAGRLGYLKDFKETTDEYIRANQ